MPPTAAIDNTIARIVNGVVGTPDNGSKIAINSASVNTAPRAKPSTGRPSVACPRPGYSSDRRNALSGSASRRVSPRITTANGVPHTSQASRTIGFRVPHTGQGQNAPTGSSGSGRADATAVSPVSLAAGVVSATAGAGTGGAGG